MPAVYPPVIAMLLALIFRGVAFEFRWRAVRPRTKVLWDWAFIFGSGVAALAQGIILGTILQGIAVDGRGYGGGWWDWLTPFSLLCGFAVTSGYALLGACWLNMKIEGPLHAPIKRLAQLFGIATVGFIVVVSLWTPFLEIAYWERWFGWPQILFVAPVPIAVGLLIVALARSLFAEGREWLPFVLSLALFLLCFLGLGISMWPWVIPPTVTIWDAASPRTSQLFMFVGAIVLVPIILAYTGYAYWVFRGKLDPDEGYH
jgi:cytochrome d ubiquinol oxidase subunit II